MLSNLLVLEGKKGTFIGQCKLKQAQKSYRYSDGWGIAELEKISFSLFLC